MAKNNERNLNVTIKNQEDNKDEVIKGYVIKDFENGNTDKNMTEFEVKLGELTDEEREIILKGCLINYNKI